VGVTITHTLEALHLVGVLLIMDREEHDQHGGSGGETSLTQGRECHVCHLLNGVVTLAPNDGPDPWCHGVEGYLHPNFTKI
jgi:hypothetical protein